MLAKSCVSVKASTSHFDKTGSLLKSQLFFLSDLIFGIESYDIYMLLHGSLKFHAIFDILRGLWDWLGHVYFQEFPKCAGHLKMLLDSVLHILGQN